MSTTAVSVRRRTAGRIAFPSSSPTTTLDHPDGSTEQRFRFLLGLAMNELRGRVPATEVAVAIRTEMGAKDD